MAFIQLVANQVNYIDNYSENSLFKQNSSKYEPFYVEFKELQFTNKFSFNSVSTVKIDTYLDGFTKIFLKIKRPELNLKYDTLTRNKILEHFKNKNINITNYNDNIDVIDFLDRELNIYNDINNILLLIDNIKSKNKFIINITTNNILKNKIETFYNMLNINNDLIVINKNQIFYVIIKFIKNLILDNHDINKDDNNDTNDDDNINNTDNDDTDDDTVDDTDDDTGDDTDDNNDYIYNNTNNTNNYNDNCLINDIKIYFDIILNDNDNIINDILTKIKKKPYKYKLINVIKKYQPNNTLSDFIYSQYILKLEQYNILNNLLHKTNILYNDSNNWLIDLNLTKKHYKYINHHINFINDIIKLYNEEYLKTKLDKYLCNEAKLYKIDITIKTFCINYLPYLIIEEIMNNFDNKIFEQIYIKINSLNILKILLRQQNIDNKLCYILDNKIMTKIYKIIENINDIMLKNNLTNPKINNILDSFKKLMTNNYFNYNNIPSLIKKINYIKDNSEKIRNLANIKNIIYNTKNNTNDICNNNTCDNDKCSNNTCRTCNNNNNDNDNDYYNKIKPYLNNIINNKKSEELINEIKKNYYIIENDKYNKISFYEYSKTELEYYLIKLYGSLTLEENIDINYIKQNINLIIVNKKKYYDELLIQKKLFLRIKNNKLPKFKFAKNISYIIENAELYIDNILYDKTDGKYITMYNILTKTKNNYKNFKRMVNFNKNNKVYIPLMLFDNKIFTYPTCDTNIYINIKTNSLKKLLIIDDFVSLPYNYEIEASILCNYIKSNELNNESLLNSLFRKYIKSKDLSSKISSEVYNELSKELKTLYISPTNTIYKTSYIKYFLDGNIANIIIYIKYNNYNPIKSLTIYLNDVKREHDKILGFYKYTQPYNNFTSINIEPNVDIITYSFCLYNTNINTGCLITDKINNLAIEYFIDDLNTDPIEITLYANKI
ncbi:hypothetical protein Hokovirus_2_151 [Hokovirus HKV1]|uniref:Uncharacterized protein n=1 Tax=Hokovirus HKV1 TaxID=1977638 RepID=A0A1V0SG57_9VIRU|nr:hypothetical protein Hokovirus_2_151 [Hokovirus HKV1]